MPHLTLAAKAALNGAAALFVALAALALAFQENLRTEIMAIVWYSLFAALDLSLGYFGATASPGATPRWAGCLTLAILLLPIAFLIFFWAPFIIVPAALVVFAIATGRKQRPSSDALDSARGQLPKT